MKSATRALAFIFACTLVTQSTHCSFPFSLVIGCMHEEEDKTQKQKTLDLLTEHLEHFEPSMSKKERRRKAFEGWRNLLFGTPIKPITDPILEPNQCSAVAPESETEKQDGCARVRIAVTLLEELTLIHPDVAELLHNVLNEPEESNIARVDEFVIKVLEIHQSLQSRL